MVDDITRLTCSALHIISAVPVNLALNISLLRQTRDDLTKANSRQGIRSSVDHLARCQLCEDHFFLTKTVINLPEFHIIMT